MEQHVLPVRPVVGETIPFSKGVPDVFVPEHLREGGVVPVSRVISADREDKVQIPNLGKMVRRVAHTTDQLDGVALVDGVVILTVRPFADVVDTAHPECPTEVLRITQGDVEGMIGTEARSGSNRKRVVVSRTGEGHHLVDDIAVVLEVSVRAPLRAGAVVVPALVVNAVDAEYLQPAVFNVARKNVNQATIFPVEKPAHRGRENYDARAVMTKGQQLHISTETGAVPLMILSIHTFTSSVSALEKDALSYGDARTNRADCSMGDIMPQLKTTIISLVKSRTSTVKTFKSVIACVISDAKNRRRYSAPPLVTYLASLISLRKKPGIFLLTSLLLSVGGTAYGQESLFDTIYDAGAQALLDRHYAEAEKKLKAALRESESFQAGDVRLQRALKALAETYDEERKFSLSEPLYRRILEGDEKSGAAGSLNLAADNTKLASNLQSQGRYEDSIPLFLKAVELFRSAEKSSVATENGKESLTWPGETESVALLQLSSAYSELGKSADAEKYLREALSVSEATRDPLSIGRSLDALGRNYISQGRYEEAEAVLNRSIKEKKVVNEAAVRRLETSTSLLLFARLFDAQGKIEDALAMIETAYQMRKSSLPENDPRVYEPMLLRASIYRDLNCYKEAVEELEKGRELVEKAFGDESPRYAEFLRDLSADLVSSSQYAKAEPLLRKALAIDESTFGKESGEVSLDLNALGMFYIYQGKYAEAEPVYKRSLAITEKRFGPEHNDTAAALNNLAWLYVNQRKFADARPLIERGLAIRKKVLGDEHPVYARNLHNLANVALEERKFEEAQQLLEKVLKIQKAVLGTKHQDTIATMRDLAELFHQNKKYSEAEDLYRAVLKYDEVSDDADRALVAADLENISRSLIEQSRGDEAKVFIDKAREIKAQLPGFNDGSEGHAISLGALKHDANAPLKAVADKWALVVGISNFKDPSINLRFAAKDAVDFRNYLIFEANFKPDHVKLLTDQNASRDNIVAHLGDKWLRRVSRPDDLVVVYVSSHGTSARKEIGDANFIVAYETNMSNAVLSGIPMQFFTTGIKDLIDCERVVIIMDVCHGGALRQKSIESVIAESRPGSAKQSAEIAAAEKAKLEKLHPGSKALVRNPNMTIGTIGSGEGLKIGSGQIILASSESDQVSWESKTYANGVFTRQLIESLRTKGENTSIQQAYRLMRGRVEQEVLRTRAEIQTPVMVQNSWHGGDVFLSVKPAAPRAVDGAQHSSLPAKTGAKSK